MTSNSPIIAVEDLHKHFRGRRQRAGLLGALRGLARSERTIVRAVDGVSFRIAPGEVVGYLGPNGAGKSTTLKMLTGLLVPTSGRVDVAGYVPWRDRRAYVAGIGAVFGQRSTLWWDLPVGESLALLRHMYRVPAARFAANLAEFGALLELDAFVDQPVRSLSLGQRMRADLAAALLHEPRLLFLDEPTIGLDVVAKERIRDFIRHINRQRGTTVLLTTHDLSDVARLCERVMIIDHGRLLYDGPLAELQRRFGGRRTLVVDLEADGLGGHGGSTERTIDVAIEIDDANLAVEGAELVAREGPRLTYKFRRDEVSASALIGRLSQRLRIRDLEVREPDIEATVRRIYEERLLEGEG